MRYRRRGRPVQHKDTKDLGTVELQNKRKAGATEEMLDRYYRLELINEKQYWAGNHFRWLYAARFGVPNVRAVDLNGTIGVQLSGEDEVWSVRLNVQYKKAQHELRMRGLLRPTLDTLIYSHCVYAYLSPAHPSSMLLDALDILVDLWC